MGQNGLASVTFDGCNDVSYAQIPGQTTFFLGRYPTDSTCKTFEVALYQMDWSKGHLAMVQPAFATPQTIADGSQITTAYDATIVSWQGVLWAAFECAGNFKSVAACVGPYDPTSGIIDPTRTTRPVISGSVIAGDTNLYSASVPKLIVFNGNAYLYWSAVKIDAAGKFQSITTRGLQVSAVGGVIMATGQTTPVISNDPALTVEVRGLGSTPTTAAVADTEGVFTDGQHIFAVAGLGGSAGCAQYPSDGGPECYHLAISRTFNPLGQGVFGGGEELPLDDVISNPQSYTRLFFAPDCSWNLMGFYFPDTTAGDPNVIAPGLKRYPIPADALFFQPATVAGGAVRVAVTFDQLTQLNPACSSTSIWSAACMAAASRACRSSYGLTAGFGPVEYSAPNATIVCVGATEAAAVTDTFQTLQTYQSKCGSANSTSVQCNAATDDACTAMGSVSGLPIEELSQTEATFACLSAPATVLTVDWSELTNASAGCSAATASQPGVCMPAADTYCQSLGHVSGFGVQQISSTQAQITCLD